MDPEERSNFDKGPRQSGKTTCLLRLKEKYRGEYVTLEDYSVLKTVEEAPRQFGARYANKRTILYLDEVQYSKNAGRNLVAVLNTSYFSRYIDGYIRRRHIEYL